MKPRVAFQVPNTLTGEGNLNVEITFESMDDFSPAAVARKVDALNKLLEARAAAREPDDLHGRQDRRRGAGQPSCCRIRRCCRRWRRRRTRRTRRLVRVAERSSGEQSWLTPNPSRTRSVGDRSRRSQRVRLAAEEGVQAEDRRGEGGRRAGGAHAGRAGAVADEADQHATSSSRSRRSSPQLDKKLTEQINLILHHEDFQKLEGAWRGLHYLVNNTETDEMLKIRVMNITQEGSRQDAQALQGHRLGPEPAVQEDLRGGVRPVRRRAVRLPGRRLLLRPHARPTSSCWARCRKIAAAAHTPFIAGAVADA